MTKGGALPSWVSKCRQVDALELGQSGESPSCTFTSSSLFKVFTSLAVRPSPRASARASNRRKTCW